MTKEDIWIKIKHIKQEIDLYEISIEKIRKRIIRLEKRKKMMNDRLPELWEEFKELYNEYHDER